MKNPAKKAKKSTLIRVSKTPPPGWPSEEEFKEAERKMRGQLATKVLPRDAGPVEIAKQKLCEHFIRYLQSEKITQRELAKRLEVTENRVSEILHYHHEQFTIDRLLELLSRVKPGITVKVA